MYMLICLLWTQLLVPSFKIPLQHLEVPAPLVAGKFEKWVWVPQSFWTFLWTADLSRHLFLQFSICRKSALIILLCPSKTLCYLITAPSHVLSTTIALLTPLRRNSLTTIIKNINTMIYHKSWVPQKHYLCTTILLPTALENTSPWPWNQKHKQFHIKLFLHRYFLDQYLPLAAEQAFWSPLAYSYGMPATIAKQLFFPVICSILCIFNF